MTTPRQAADQMPPMLVKGALVPFKNPEGKMEYRYRGAQVPTWCDPDDLNRYLRDDLIELADSDAYKAAPIDLPSNAGEPAFQIIPAQLLNARRAR